VTVPKPSRRPLIIVGALMLATGAYLATIPLAGPGVGTASPSGAFYPIGSVSEGIGVGQAAPDFGASGSDASVLVGLDGSPIHLAALSGHPVWIVFWATWCMPCQQEVTDIKGTFDAHRSSGLVVLAVDVQEPASSVRDYVAAHGIDYEVALDSTGSVKRLYGAWGLPTHYFVDRAGVIRDRYFGQLSAPLMETHLKAILAE
jgi:cytochrome c biogenesis protein CcmG, thiol:disulfide interchange protein DsbE